jgi:hypothetical protein
MSGHRIDIPAVRIGKTEALRRVVATLRANGHTVHWLNEPKPPPFPMRNTTLEITLAEDNHTIQVQARSVLHGILLILCQVKELYGATLFEGDPEGLAECVDSVEVTNHYQRKDFSTPEDNFIILRTDRPAPPATIPDQCPAWWGDPITWKRADLVPEAMKRQPGEWWHSWQDRLNRQGFEVGEDSHGIWVYWMGNRRTATVCHGPAGDNETTT